MFNLTAGVYFISILYTWYIFRDVASCVWLNAKNEEELHKGARTTMCYDKYSHYTYHNHFGTQCCYVPGYVEAFPLLIYLLHSFCKVITNTSVFCSVTLRSILIFTSWVIPAALFRMNNYLSLCERLVMGSVCPGDQSFRGRAAARTGPSIL